MDVGPGPEGNIINWGGPGGEGCRGTSVVKTRRMTGSALRLEESRDGRWCRPGGKYLSTGEVQEGKGKISRRDSPLADDGKRA